MNESIIVGTFKLQNTFSSGNHQIHLESNTALPKFTRPRPPPLLGGKEMILQLTRWLLSSPPRPTPITDQFFSLVSNLLAIFIGIWKWKGNRSKLESSAKLWLQLDSQFWQPRKFAEVLYFTRLDLFSADISSRKPQVQISNYPGTQEQESSNLGIYIEIINTTSYRLITFPSFIGTYGKWAMNSVRYWRYAKLVLSSA